MQIWPGRSYPLGATYDGAGTNFALFSEVSTRAALCESAAAHAVARDDRLRSPRQGLHPAASRRTTGAARQVRRTRIARRDRVPQGSRRDRRRAVAGAPVRAFATTSGFRITELLGIRFD